MHNHLSRLLLILIFALLISTLPYHLAVSQRNEPLQRSLTSITRSMIFTDQAVFYGDYWSKTTNLTTVFMLDGSIRAFNNNTGYMLLNPFHIGPSALQIWLYYNSTYIAQFYNRTGVTLWLYYDFSKSDRSIKITMSGVLPNAVNALTMTLNLTVPDPQAFSISSGSLMYSWKDVHSGASYNVTSSTITYSVPATFTIDPTLVDTDTSTDALNYPYQTRILYMKSLDWVFYSDGTNLKYKTSYDSWTTATTLTTCAYGFRADVFYDSANDYFDYVVIDSTSTAFLYRRGTPSATGSFSWLASEQTTIEITQTGRTIFYPSITINSTGYVHVLYCEFNGVSNWNLYHIYNTQTNGLWTNGTRTTVATALGVSIKGILRHFSNDDLIALFSTVNLQTIRYKIWNATSNSWSAASVYSGANSYVSDMQVASVVSSGLNVYAAYLNGTPYYQCLFREATCNATAQLTFENEELMTTTGFGGLLDPTYSRFAVCTNQTASNQTWAFYYNATTPTSTEIHYILRSEIAPNTWTQFFWITENRPTYAPLFSSIHCYDTIHNNQIGVIYMTNQTSPFEIRIAYLTFGGALIWHNITSWLIQLSVRQWISINSWLLQLQTRQWNLISAWQIQLLTLGWHLISGWLIQLGPASTAFLIIPIIFLASIVLGVLVLAYKRKN